MIICACNLALRQFSQAIHEYNPKAHLRRFRSHVERRKREFFVGEFHTPGLPQWDLVYVYASVNRMWMCVCVCLNVHVAVSVRAYKYLWEIECHGVILCGCMCVCRHQDVWMFELFRRDWSAYISKQAHKQVSCVSRSVFDERCMGIWIIYKRLICIHMHTCAQVWSFILRFVHVVYHFECVILSLAMYACAVCMYIYMYVYLYVYIVCCAFVVAVLCTYTWRHTHLLACLCSCAPKHNILLIYVHLNIPYYSFMCT
jgi:hypothetical protein